MFEPVKVGFISSLIHLAIFVAPTEDFFPTSLEMVFFDLIVPGVYCGSLLSS